MQCVYAVVKGIYDKGMNWEVLVSPELDAVVWILQLLFHLKMEQKYFQFK